MKPSELHRRLRLVGAVEVPTGYPPELAARWTRFEVCGHAYDVPRDDGLTGAGLSVRFAIEEIGRNKAIRQAGIRFDWPEWLDEPIGRCPRCDGEVCVEVDAEGWEIGCVAGGGCAAVYAGEGEIPTAAKWLGESAIGRRALAALGHPLGGGR